MLFTKIKLVIAATLLFSVFLINLSLAQDTCSRMATINQQEVLIDNNSNQKGEGLRYHLEKDATAKSYLDRYQKGTRTKLETTILGTTGSALIFAGILTNSSSNNNTRLILGGVSILVINFLITKTLDYGNEENLIKAIDEYNKRNLPKIQFIPEASINGSYRYDSFKLALDKSWSF